MRYAPALLAAAFSFLSCGGGGGGGAAAAAASYDADPSASPAPDPTYYQVPSVALGARVGGGQVTFSHWNPAAQAVTVHLFDTWNAALDAPTRTIPLTRGAGGVWSSPALPLPSQPYYVFKVDSRFVLDPYARSMAKWSHNSFGYIPGDPMGKGALLDPEAVGPGSSARRAMRPSSHRWPWVWTEASRWSTGCQEL